MGESTVWVGHTVQQMPHQCDILSALLPCEDGNPGHKSYQLKPFADEMWEKVCVWTQTLRLTNHNNGRKTMQHTVLSFNEIY